jgi:lambda family phage portal protein
MAPLDGIRLYEGSLSTSQRPRRGSGASADATTQAGTVRLREEARYLDENHDLAIGILDDLVANIVGTGVGIEPMVVSATGKPLTKINDALRDLWSEFWRRPDVTQELPGPELERLICRSWLRDGEVFVQHVVKDLAPYPTGLRYALEAIEADLVPFDYEQNGALQGVVKDTWGTVIGYYVFKSHPGDAFGILRAAGKWPEVKFLRAEQMSHIKLTRRLHQTRGVSVFHGALTRLRDLKDYENSEQLAARVSADWVGYIKRSADFRSSTLDANNNRTYQMAPGMIFSDLLPGEDVGTIKSERPNTALPEFRKAMLKAIAAGTHARYSPIARSYDGTYSAQRQELIEGAIHYRMLFSYLAEQFYLPVWQRFVDAAMLGGLVRVPMQVKPLSLYRPELRPPQLGWIDPLKEVQAAELAVRNGFKARAQVIRDLGGDPRAVDQQLAADTFEAEAAQAAADDPEDTQEESA